MLIEDVSTDVVRKANPVRCCYRCQRIKDKDIELCQYNETPEGVQLEETGDYETTLTLGRFKATVLATAVGATSVRAVHNRVDLRVEFEGVETAIVETHQWLIDQQTAEDAIRNAVRDQEERRRVDQADGWLAALGVLGAVEQ